MACDAATLIAAACEGGYDGLQDRQLMEATAYLLCTAGAGGGQIRQYTADPTVEGILPANQDLPAVAYAAGGVGATYTWNTTTHVWM